MLRLAAEPTKFKFRLETSRSADEQTYAGVVYYDENGGDRRKTNVTPAGGGSTVHKRPSTESNKKAIVSGAAYPRLSVGLSPFLSNQDNDYRGRDKPTGDPPRAALLRLIEHAHCRMKLISI